MGKEGEDAIVWHEGDMPFSTRFGDHFYSRENGLAETRHVFIAGNRLLERWQAQNNFHIGELGFGTGLNMLTTWQAWKAQRRSGQNLTLTSFEKFPLDSETLNRALANWPELADEVAALLAVWPQPKPLEDLVVDLDDGVRLQLLIGDAAARLTAWDGSADAWYLDGFAPARNPDMWSADLLGAVFDKTKPGGTFATYAAAGFVRRNLQAAGFTVDRLPGHGMKREMLAGTRTA
jgi:tRNA U34 5-methylaminomethyl-2-thiouridine-forming methyltransferase MnmC